MIHAINLYHWWSHSPCSQTWAEGRAECLVSNSILLHELDRCITGWDEIDSIKERKKGQGDEEEEEEEEEQEEEEEEEEESSYMNVELSGSHFQKQRQPSLAVEARYLRVCVCVCVLITETALRNCTLLHRPGVFIRGW